MYSYILGRETQEEKAVLEIHNIHSKKSRVFFSGSRITKLQDQTTYLLNVLNMGKMHCVPGYTI